MALDKLIDSTQLDSALNATATAILEKLGESDPITWDADKGFEDAIDGISVGIDVSNTTLMPDRAASGYTYYNSSGRLVSGTLTAQAAQTIMPTTSDQTIARGKYLTGTQTIKGDANLVAENIKKDVTIFGVTGTLESGGGGGATEYTFNATTLPISGETVFDLSNSGLTMSDLVLDGHTIIWMELTQNCTVEVWLDSEGDDKFHLTLPSGMKIIMTMSQVTQYGIDYTGVFAYQASNYSRPYGRVNFNYSAMDGYFVTMSDGGNREMGGASQDSGYNAVNGVPNIFYHPNSVLHILKY